jgi:hypothetical protein
MKTDTAAKTAKVLRTTLVVTGCAVTIIALLADRLGFGDPGGLGTGQLLLALVGLFLGLAGLLGKRIASLYRAVALILLNTVVLLGALELGTIVFFRSGLLPAYRGIMVGYPELPYYAAQDWTEVYWQEAKLSERYRYQPYVVWRHLPFEGDTIRIDEEGIRLTPGADCRRDAYTVFAFGGSTMLGWGSPDWGTIPAYLQGGLEGLVGKPVCVVNLAEDGFVSSQSLIALTRELQSGNVPDMVIFYDGINEVIAAYESGEPNVHVTLAKIAARFEEPEHPLLQWVKGSRMYALVETLAGSLAPQGQQSGLDMFASQPTQTDIPYLADAVAEVYLANYRIVSALAQEHGFEYSFYLQPHLAVSEKKLTREEQDLESKMDPVLASLAQAVYASIASAAPDHEHLWLIAGVLDEEPTQVWIDQWGHITPEGNHLVAQEILTNIERQLAEE